MKTLPADGFKRADLLRLILIARDPDHFAAFSAWRQLVFECLLAAGFDLNVSRHVVAGQKPLRAVARKREIPFDSFDRFGFGVLNDNLNQLSVANDSRV